MCENKPCRVGNVLQDTQRGTKVKLEPFTKGCKRKLTQEPSKCA